jgi:hypothetical protein
MFEVGKTYELYWGLAALLIATSNCFAAPPASCVNRFVGQWKNVNPSDVFTGAFTSFVSRSLFRRRLRALFHQGLH